MLEPFLNPAARELDLIQLSLLVFLPAAVAVLLFAVPARFPELMRWLAVFGTAGTLVVALCTLVDYHRLLESYSDRSTRTNYHPATRLDARSEEQQSAAAQPVPKPQAYSSFDLLARRPWVSQFDVDYALGVDGLSLALVLLTCVVCLLAVVASWPIAENVRAYLVLVLLLQTGVLGAFLAVDLVLFYVFYELMLFPMYFLIGLWGGGRRKYAAVKFVLYTLVGGAAILAAIVALHAIDVRDFVDQATVAERAAELKKDSSGMSDADAKANAAVHTFDPVTLGRVGRAVMLVLTNQEDRLAVRTTPSDAPLPTDTSRDVRLFAPGVDRVAAIARLKSQAVCTPGFQYLMFALLAVGFAVKVPIVPLHSWLPDAHVEAPTPVSMILAGVLLKLGGYGLIRFAVPLCPFAFSHLAWWVGLVGVVGIVYGAVVALGQTDFKKLLAYSSVSHMGYVLLGLASWGTSATHWETGMAGAVFQMLAHGITAAGLFFVVGVVYERGHTRDMNQLGGLREPMPVYAGLSAILVFASLGLPGLCGFVGEFLAMTAGWAFDPWLTAPAILTTVLTAGYLLWAWQRVFLGVNPATAAFPDVTAREILVLAPLVLLAIALGIQPGPTVFQWSEPATQALVDSLARLR